MEWPDRGNIRLELPLSVNISSRKRFILNLNNYRNAHHQVLSKAKRNYSAIVRDLLSRQRLPANPVKNCTVTLIYHHGSRRKIDTSNPCSIIEKFANDALTDAGVWEDDDSKTILATSYVSGDIDKDNPHCEYVVSWGAGIIKSFTQ